MGTDLLLIEGALSKIQEGKIRSLVAIIKDLESVVKAGRRYSDEQIARFTGITAVELEALRNTGLYRDSLHSIINSDADLVRDTLRSDIVPVTRCIAKKAKAGSDKAQQLFMKLVMSKEETQISVLDKHLAFLAKFGIRSRENKAHRILDGKNDEIIDAEYVSEEEDIVLEDDSELIDTEMDCSLEEQHFEENDEDAEEE